MNYPLEIFSEALEYHFWFQMGFTLNLSLIFSWLAASSHLASPSITCKVASLLWISFWLPVKRGFFWDPLMLEAGNFWIMTVNIISQKDFTVAPFFPAPAATTVERAVLFSLSDSLLSPAWSLQFLLSSYSEEPE